MMLIENDDDDDNEERQPNENDDDGRQQINEDDDTYGAISSRERKSSRTRMQRECKRFSEHRWKWLAGLLLGVGVPLLLNCPSRFSFWLFANVIGFVYVAGATQERRDPILSRVSADGHRELIKLLLFSPFVFLLGPKFTLLSGSSQCGSGGPFADDEYDDDARQSIVLLDGVFGVVDVDARFYVYFVYMFFGWLVPFFVGLHFTYLSYAPWLGKIVLRVDKLRRLTPAHWIFLATVAALVLVLVAYQLQLFVEYDLLVTYLIGVCFALALIIGAAVYQVKRHGRAIHLHHYQFFGSLILLTRFENLISSIFQALLCGIYIEGIAQWSADSLFD
jgi:hypothetical protein